MTDEQIQKQLDTLWKEWNKKWLTTQNQSADSIKKIIDQFYNKLSSLSSQIHYTHTPDDDIFNIKAFPQAQEYINTAALSTLEAIIEEFKELNKEAVEQANELTLTTTQKVTSSLVDVDPQKAYAQQNQLLHDNNLLNRWRYWSAYYDDNLLPDIYKELGNKYSTQWKLQTYFSEKKISNRVWNYLNADIAKTLATIDYNIHTGKAATSWAKDIKDALNNPDVLFRRIRDEHGDLKESKAMKAFEVERGVYKSSYKNVVRLAITETNAAYNLTHTIAWRDLSFVDGIQIKLSNAHNVRNAFGEVYSTKTRPLPDICDDNADKVFPKNFIFCGWHPLCRCYAIPHIATSRLLKSLDPPHNDPADFKNTIPDDALPF